MTIQVDAVYQGGVLLPAQPLGLPDGSHVRIAIQTQDGGDDPLAAVVGIAEGPEQGDVAERHDDYLYGGKSE